MGALGMKYPLEGIVPPSKERVENANHLLHTNEYPKRKGMRHTSFLL